MKRSKNSPIYAYGVRLDGMPWPQTFIALGLVALVALVLAIVQGAPVPLAVFVFDTIWLVFIARQQRRIVDLIARRIKEANDARADLAFRAGHSARYRLAMGLQKPLELAR